MARKVTITFDNGATHTYEGVPMSASPESVLERARRDFGDRAVTNIDGGREKGGKDYVLDVGKGLASLADVALSIPGAVAGEVAYAGGRAFGQSPEKASALRQTVTGATTNPIGQALGITQDPAYQGEAVRSAFGAVGQGMQAAAAPVAQATGLPQQDVESMMGSALTAVAPAAVRGAAATGRGVQAVGRGAVEVAKAPVKIGRGFAEGVLNPEPTPNSAMVPLQKQAYPAQAGREFMSGNMSLPELEASRVPSASLFASPLDQTAMKALPRNAAGQPLVPLAGRGLEAIGENLGRGYRNQPLQAAADLGLMSLGVPPIGPAARAVQGLASLRAGKAADFSPGFTERLGQARGRAGIQSNMPTTPQLGYTLPSGGGGSGGSGSGGGSPGPVNLATMYAGAGGVSADLPQAGRAALDVRYPPMPPVDTKAAVQAAAAARITTTPSQSLASTAKGQEIAAVLAQRKAAELAAKQQRWAAGGAKIPDAEPVAGPVASIPPEPAAAPANTMDRLRNRLTPQTADEAAKVEAYNALSPADKAAQTRAQRRPGDVREMMTEEQLKVFNALKRSDSTANLLRQLKESGDPNAKSLAELLEKQGYNNKNK